MKRFIVLDPFGGLIAETDDIAEAQAHGRAGMRVGCLVEPPVLKPLEYFIGEALETLEERLVRREWKAARIAVDPTCAFCGRELTLAGATVDHLQPLCQGGADDPGNWELSCSRCNSDKGQLSAQEFLERMANARALRGWLASRELATA